MVCFRKYISEGMNEERSTDMDEDRFIWEVRKKCKPTLRVMNKTGYFFDRIEMSTFGQYFKKETRRFRKPLDTIDEYHEAMDGWFLKKFGWRARSENVLFVYGRKIKNDYYVFPIGKFKFVWSSKVRDATGQFQLDDSGGNPDIDYLIKNIEGSNYSDKNIIAAIKSGNEIMIQCKEYYGMLWTYDKEDIIEELLKGV